MPFNLVEMSVHGAIQKEWILFLPIFRLPRIRKTSDSKDQVDLWIFYIKLFLGLYKKKFLFKFKGSEGRRKIKKLRKVRFDIQIWTPRRRLDLILHKRL